MVRTRWLALTVTVLALLARTVLAQQVGTVAEVEGTVDLRHQGTWGPATIGTAVSKGDELRTAVGGKARLVFRDESVLNLAGDTHVVIDEQIFDTEQGVFRSLIRLVKGKVRPLISEYYGRPGAVYDVETPTGFAGVRGTEFVIAYDPVADTSEVVGVTGRVEAHSTLDRIGHGVFVTSQNLTIIARGKFPTKPQPIPDRLFRQYLEDTEFIGGGRPESLTIGHPILAGAFVPASDRAAVLPGPPAAVSGVGGVPGQAPWDEGHNAGAVTGQPFPAITTGDLGINF